MSAIARVILVVVVVLAVIATQVVDPVLRQWLAGVIKSPLAPDAAAWAVRFAVWCAPLLLWRRTWEMGSPRLRWTWTILLVLPYALLNLLFFRWSTGMPGLQSISLGMAIGAWEELAFRGYALNRCEAHPRLAITVSALAFAFMHSGYPVANIITAFFVAIGFGVLRVASGGLGWGILIHGLTDIFGEANPPDWAIIPVALATSAASVLALWRLPKLRAERKSASPTPQPRCG